MPRAPEPLDDVTPLDAARIDVSVRIGWLLRTHRTVAGLSLRDMAAALGEHGVRLSAATLSRMETEGQQPGAVMDGYGKVLGLPRGQLRTVGTMMFHTFPYGPPPAHESVPRDLESFSRVCAAVEAEGPTAGDWLEFARYHASDVGYGLPLSSMEPLASRLIGEAGRGIREGRMIRHDALVTLLRSPYHDLVSDMVREALADARQQIIFDLASIISDAPTLVTLHWLGRLLSGPTRFHVQGASAALQNMVVGNKLSLEAWRELVPYLERARKCVNGEAERTAALTALCSALPPAVQADLSTIGHKPTTPRTTVAWSRSTSNPHFAFALRIAQTVTDRLGQPDEPLLARLLFEALFEPRLVRRSMGYWLVAFSAFGDETLLAILHLLEAAPDPETRSAALRVAAVCHRGQPLTGLEALLELPGDPDFFEVLHLVGRSGAELPEASLRRGLAGTESIRRQTLYCLGMAGDPRLADLAEDATLPDDVREGARWWLAAGSRLLV